MKFMNDYFLLNDEIGKDLYFKYARDKPIIDYHCHIDAKEIAEDRQFENITSIMLSGDHYKWRLMRTAGISEEQITGSATDLEKFKAFASVLPMAIGNPIYHWTHLELKTYFGYEGILNENTAVEVWNLCNEVISREQLSPRKIIEMSNVEVICTTDDPVDNLDAHIKCSKDTNLKVKVLPTFRPDKAIKINAPGFREYVDSLAAAAGLSINTMDDLLRALDLRIEYFHSIGCRISDHGLDTIVFDIDNSVDVGEVFRKKLDGQALTVKEINCYITSVMLYLGKMYADKGWAMQLHYGALRNTNSKMFRRLGPDSGFDCIGETACVNALAGYLDALDSEDKLPRTIIYSLNGNDNAVLDTLVGCFANEKGKGWVQHGAAWWFNDTLSGMRDQLQNLSSHSLIGVFIGMLTDSRCFLSFSRHEYFRRLLCGWVSDLVKEGQFPEDEKALKRIIEDISYYNAKEYFKWSKE